MPRSVLERPLHLGVLQFGFELGTGVRTYLSSTAPYVLALGLLVLDASVAHAFMAGVGLGLGRAVMLFARLGSSMGGRWDVALDQRVRWLIPFLTAMSAFSVFAIGLGPPS